MKVLTALQTKTTQADFADLIGVAAGTVSAMFTEGHLDREATCHTWLLAYCARLREQAAGRMGREDDAISLVTERALLAREQRIGQEMKNAAMRDELVPARLLAEVLATASSAIAERLDLLPSDLRRRCPEMTQRQLDRVAAVVSEALNHWVASTIELMVRKIETTDDDDPPLTPTNPGETA